MKKHTKKLIGLLIILIGCMTFNFCMAKNKNTQINVKIGKKTFKATLYNNKTSKVLLKKLPVTYKMSELNGNEKYKYLSYDLPTNEKKVRKIKAGDIMLYGSDCLVVFYKNFKTSYRYTKVGHINNTKGLAKALGKGSVKVKFMKKGKKTNQATTTASNNTEHPSETPVQSSDFTEQPTVPPTVTEQISDNPSNTPKNTEDTDMNKTNQTTTPEQQVNDKKLMVKIGDKKVNVEWEENESVEALMELCKDAPLEVKMSMYGGFEQVGSLGTNLPRNDVQTSTSSGDIVLYSGNQIVVFYGSNSWSYTRLGHITDQDNAGMTELLGNGDVTITIGME